MDANGQTLALFDLDVSGVPQIAFWCSFTISSCHLSLWLSVNKLKLNPDKKEFIFFCSRTFHTKLLPT